MEWIVCCWYTPDYNVWAQGLISSLELAGAPYDVQQVEKLPGGWEANTRRKAEILLKFMAGHQGKTIILVDADATVSGNLSELALTPGDICLHGRLKNRAGNAWMQWHTGTMVVKPWARAFIERWRDLSAGAVHGENDQSTLTKAILASHGLSIGVLGDRWIWGSNDGGACIRHGQASRTMRKVTPAVRVAIQVFQSWFSAPSRDRQRYGSAPDAH